MKSFILCFLLCSSSLNYVVEGWTEEEMIEEIVLCVSSRLENMQTDYSVSMLEKICYYQVIKEGKK